MALPAPIPLTLIPRLTALARTADLRSLTLSPTDGFVLSRIDGLSTGHAIVAATGLSDADVAESLALLVQQRLVELPAKVSASSAAHSLPPGALHPRPSRPAIRASVMPPSLDSAVKANISGSYAQVATDRPSARPRPSVPAPPPPPSAPSFASPPRSDTPTSVMAQRPPSRTPPPRSSPVTFSSAPSSPPPPPSAPRLSSPQASAPISASPPRPPPPSAPTSSPASPVSSVASDVTVDGIDLEAAFRARVEDLFANIDSLDYYTLLSVDRAADKKAVKRAYYELASHFHPDKYFRKNLGHYKAKMEAIFGRFTIAHDTLTSKVERAEYDAYLGIRASVREQENLLASAQDEIRRAEEDAQRAAQQNVAISVNPPAPEPRTPPPRSAPPVTAVTPVSPINPTHATSAANATGATSAPAPAPRLGPQFTPSRSFDVQAAREALARKLLGGAGPHVGRASSASISSMPGSGASAAQSSSPPTAPASMNPRDAVDALKRRYDERVQESRSAQVAKYRANADALIAKGDLAAGLNSLRVALSFDPESPELYALTLQTQKKADEVLSESYEKQARYEEKAEHWIDAAKSWTKVARARPTDAYAHERAAHALLRSQGNLREASELAKRAVTLDPKTAAHRATLGAVYLAGGMVLNARREIEAALQIAPNDPAVLHAARRLREVG